MQVDSQEPNGSGRQCAMFSFRPLSLTNDGVNDSKIIDHVQRRYILFHVSFKCAIGTLIKHKFAGT